jgi:hypothetical protein
MDRGSQLLQELRNKLLGWQHYWQRSLHPTRIAFESGTNGEFAVTLVWSKDSGDLTYRKEFTRAYTFGTSYAYSPDAWRLELKPCEYARLLVREVLEQRGIR